MLARTKPWWRTPRFAIPIFLLYASFAAIALAAYWRSHDCLEWSDTGRLTCAAAGRFGGTVCVSSKQCVRWRE
ncbi:MAG: hypothetical protein AAFZ18_08360 [Myxococcota bacterium]